MSDPEFEIYFGELQTLIRNGMEFTRAKEGAVLCVALCRAIRAHKQFEAAH